MNTDQLRADLLEHARRAPTPSGTLAQDVLRRRRTTRRQHLSLTGAAVAVVLVVAGLPLAIATLRTVPGPVATAEIYTLAPRGSLADDDELIALLGALPWTAEEGYTGSDGSAYAAGTDLAAGIPGSERRVVYVGDVPGGRWALLAIRTEGGAAAAWFTGPEDATAQEMAMSGPAQLVVDGEPVAHVDVSNPEKAVVVVAAPGDDVMISRRAEIDADGQEERLFRTVDADDGIAVAQLDTDLRYGVAARIQVERGEELVYDARPTSAGAVPGVRSDTYGWDENDPEAPSVLSRTGRTYAITRTLGDTLLSSLLGPTGLTLRDVTTGEPPITELFSGDRNGPAGSRLTDPPIVDPVITMWSLRLPSGAYGVVGGWGTWDTQDPPQEQTLLAVRAASDDPTRGVVANRMRIPATDTGPAADLLVIAGPTTGARTAQVLDEQRNVLQRVDLYDGAAVVPTPVGADSVRVLDADDRIVGVGSLQDMLDPAAFGFLGERPPTVITVIPPL